jgi:hypothetical protein
MKTVAIGDTHGRSFWKLIIEQEKPFDKLIFIGDYFDTHETISPELQAINFREICQYKEENSDKVILLIGNHDEHYFPFMGNSGTSGYNTGAAPAIGHLLMTYKDLLKMAHAEDNLLFSHAGIGETWLINNHPDLETNPGIYLFNSAKDIANKVNELWKFKPLLFKFNGWEPTGDNVGQTPIWIRPRSLMKDSQKMKENGITQIVGHTQQNQIDIKGKATGGKYYFIDTLGTSGEYLIINNGEFKTEKL